MGFWWWVLIFVDIGLAALALFALLGLSLWRKTKVVAADLGRISALVAAAEVAMSAAARPAGAEPYGDMLHEVDDPTPAVHGSRHAR